jgi:hypothetical protein
MAPSEQCNVYQQIDYLADELTKMEAAMIDPREFGRLESEVKALQTQMNSVQTDIKSLLELANKGRGGFWAGMAIASFLGGIATFVVDKVMAK